MTSASRHGVTGPGSSRLKISVKLPRAAWGIETSSPIHWQESVTVVTAAIIFVLPPRLTVSESDSLCCGTPGSPSALPPEVGFLARTKDVSNRLTESLLPGRLADSVDFLFRFVEFDFFSLTITYANMAIWL